MGSDNLHEKKEVLSTETLDFHRAYSSLKEEIEAINWYSQRVDVSDDENLAKILDHNKNEEIEHACMMLEWLRRNSDEWNHQMRTYLFKEGEITELEEKETEDQNDKTDLGIRKM